MMQVNKTGIRIHLFVCLFVYCVQKCALTFFLAKNVFKTIKTSKNVRGELELTYIPVMRFELLFA